MAHDPSEKSQEPRQSSDVPLIPPEEMAKRFSSDELHSAMSLFKGFAKLAKRTDDPADKAKAEYWRKVADVLSRSSQ